MPVEVKNWRKKDKINEEEDIKKREDELKKECEKAVFDLRNKYVAFLKRNKGKAYTVGEITNACGFLPKKCGGSYYGFNYGFNSETYYRKISWEEELLRSIKGDSCCNHKDIFRHPNITGYSSGISFDKELHYFYWTE